MNPREKLLAHLSANADMLTPDQAARVEAMREPAGPLGAFAVTGGSASLGRYESAKMEVAYARLAKYPEAQAEAIARHYVALAATARDLLEIVNLKRHGQRGETDEVIRYLTQQIKDNHRRDLGLELSWPNK